MNKIQKLSRFFKMLFWVILVGWPIVLTLIWWMPIPFLDALGFNIAGFLPNGLFDIVEAPITTNMRFWGFIISFIPMGIGMTISYLFIKLFSCYEQAEIFTIQSIGYLKKSALILFVSPILDALYQALISLTMTIHNPAGHKMIQISISAEMVRNLITAGLVFLVAYIMQEGVKLREEQSLTV